MNEYNIIPSIADQKLSIKTQMPENLSLLNLCELDTLLCAVENEYENIEDNWANECMRKVLEDWAIDIRREVKKTLLRRMRYE